MGAAESMARTLAVFDTVSVGGDNPSHVPGKGMHLAIWPQVGDGVQSSGMGALSMRVDLMFRIYGPLQQYPRDEIDIDMIRALDKLGQALCADFTLGGLVRQIDTQGHEGAPIGFTTGFLDVQEQTSRVVTLRCPLIANDVWTYGS